ncbi:class II aldolase/adducin family protein [Sphingomonas sp. 3-13AW]|uniref:class II aldolase/adducin family protein n=1 Tax=Sphingomonas sp. 3-13AW TaxID=3050450 RepID=UPI003BB6CF2C
MKKIHVLGGGTFSPVANHLSLCAPAFGGTARQIAHSLRNGVRVEDLAGDGTARVADIGCEVVLTLTKMADPASSLVTNVDVAEHIDALIADPDTRCIIMNVALCDYDAVVEGRPGDFHGDRFRTADGPRVINITPAEKLISRIRKERKDIFVVGFKTTTGASSDDQYAIALKALKRDSLNLMLANDTVTRNNMIVAPEETRYCETIDRASVLSALALMLHSRLQNTFTRSTVIDAPSVAWSDPRVPASLRSVVDHLIQRGAYKPVNGVTAGHFAVRVDDRTILTSKRKQDFNRLPEIGLVQVEYEGFDRVLAYGAKPSVGGQSQRIVFTEHPNLDCIVHAHVPMREDAPDVLAIGTADQWRNECGSHQCGQATSSGLRPISNGIHAVMLDNHGPNVVFPKDADPDEVIAFIERNFDLQAKTGGLVAA